MGAAAHSLVVFDPVWLIKEVRLHTSGFQADPGLKKAPCGEKPVLVLTISSENYRLKQGKQE